MTKILFLFLVLVLPTAVRADKASDPPASTPIRMKMDLGILGVWGSSMEYSLNGKKLNSYDDFKKVIYPFNDPEASKLIREAEEAHFGATLFYGAGILTGLDIALNFNPTPIVHNDFIDRILTGLVITQIFIGIGGHLDSNADGRKFNAVQRYNRLVRQEKSAFLGFTPEVSMNGNGLNLGLAHTF